LSPWPARILGLSRRQLFNIYVLAGSVGIVLAVTLYTLHVSARIEQQSRVATQLLSSLASRALAEGSQASMQEIMRAVNEIEVPFVMTDNSGRPLYWNAPVIGIPMPESLADVQAVDPARPQDPAVRSVLALVARFDAEHEPFAIVDPRTGLRQGTLHYGSSALSRQIRWMPHLELALLAAFFLLIVWALLMKKEGEQQRLFAGMAKETAHQMGTPLTAMLGWLQLLRERLGPAERIIFVEETDPFLEQNVTSSMAQHGEKVYRFYGQASGHISGEAGPGLGELNTDLVAAGLSKAFELPNPVVLPETEIGRASCRERV